jgi:hypothetical protein
MIWMRLAALVWCLHLGALADSPSVHGMLLFGTKTTYLSHLPMFHSPHDYQWIFEAQLDAKSTAELAILRKKNLVEKVWTVVPEPFSLPKMAAAPKVFLADIYKGHFERGGTKVLSKASVSIVQHIHFRKLLGNSKPTASSFVFGKPGEYFSAHSIETPPDFDRIAAVEIQNDGTIRELELIYEETSDLER